MSVFDMHTHILPKMDDGSESLEETRALTALLQEQGVTQLCATSHYYGQRESMDSFLLRRETALRQAYEAEPRLRDMLHVGAEVAYVRGMSKWDGLAHLCLSGTRTLLLEMPFWEWNNSCIEEVTRLVLDLNYQVILAHPERYYYGDGNQDALERLAVLPLAFQVNADTLASWRSRSVGLTLLRMTRYPLLGSDCHHTDFRAPHMDKARTVVQKKLGADFLARIDETAQRFTQLSAEAKG